MKRSRGSEVAQVCVQDTIQAVSIVDLYVAPSAVAIDHQCELHDTSRVAEGRHLVEVIGLSGAVATNQLPRFRCQHKGHRRKLRVNRWK